MDKIFVFGSNLAGRHGAGAAKYALEHKGARYGVGIGLHGQSYALPTKGHHIDTLPLALIEWHIDHFIDYAIATKNIFEFEVTRIGCGLAGYKDEQIAPLFFEVPDNCIMPIQWRKYLFSDSLRYHNEGVRCLIDGTPIE